MLVQSWQLIAIFVVSFAFGFGIGRTYGESRAWAKMDKLEQARMAFQAVPSYCERFAREGFTPDEQAAIAESMTMEEAMARQFACRLMDESHPYPVLDIPYAEDDEPLHTDENGYRCGKRDCPCMIGHVIDGRIIVEQEILG